MVRDGIRTNVFTRLGINWNHCDSNLSYACHLPLLGCDVCRPIVMDINPIARSAAAALNKRVCCLEADTQVPHLGNELLITSTSCTPRNLRMQCNVIYTFLTFC